MTFQSHMPFLPTHVLVVSKSNASTSSTQIFPCLNTFPWCILHVTNQFPYESIYLMSDSGDRTRTGEVLTNLHGGLKFHHSLAALLAPAPWSENIGPPKRSEKLQPQHNLIPPPKNNMDFLGDLPNKRKLPIQTAPFLPPINRWVVEVGPMGNLWRCCSCFCITGVA